MSNLIGPYRRAVGKPILGHGKVFTPMSTKPNYETITVGEKDALKQKLSKEYQKVASLGCDAVMDAFLKGLSRG
jgi:hypothetical protein